MPRLLYREFAPGPRIAAVADCLWSVEVAPDGPGTPCHWVLPDGCYTLSIGLRPRWSVSLRAPALAPFRAPCTPGESIAGARLRPGANPAAAMNAIRRRLRRGQSEAEVFAVLEDALALEAIEPDRRIARMVEVQRAARGMATLAELAEEAGVGERQLERLARRSAGISPKGFARVTRLQAVLRRMIADRAAPLAGTAAEFGFADQTHMTREFRQLGHLTPAAYGRMIGDVGFVLEGADAVG